MGKIYDLDLVEEINFLDFFQDNKEAYNDLLWKMGFKYEGPEHIDENLWEVSHLYKVVVFRKSGGGKAMQDFRRDFWNFPVYTQPIYKAKENNQSQNEDYYEDDNSE